MFITFEGLDGAGKSTQIQRLQTRLDALNQSVVVTREPGGTTIGDRLREMLLDAGETQLAPRTEALLYAASRAQLLHEVIQPALARGKMVICDRYVDASIAYQGAALGLGTMAVAEMNQFATSHLEPDLTFLMDIPVTTSRDRVLNGREGQNPDRIEQRSVDYFERVRDAFLTIARSSPNRVCVLDASLPANRLEQEIWGVVSKWSGTLLTGTPRNVKSERWCSHDENGRCDYPGQG